MPIEGGTPRACFDVYREHVSKLLGKTLPTPEPVLFATARKDPTRGVLTLGPQSRSVTVLKSRTHGKVFFSLAQELCALSIEGGRWRLRTLSYWYKLFQREPDPAAEPALRWEYVAEPPIGKQWCRHHFQIGRVGPPDGNAALELAIGAGSVDLNRLHVPTGFVLMEYVLRFLISELGIAPPCGDTWPDVLLESENKFFREFSPKTSRPRSSQGHA